MISFGIYFSKGVDCILNYRQGSVLRAPLHTRNLKMDGTFAGEAGTFCVELLSRIFFFLFLDEVNMFLENLNLKRSTCL